MTTRRINRSVMAASMFCALAGSTAWAEQGALPEELEALKHTMQQIILENQELRRRIRALEEAMVKQGQATKEPAEEAAPKEPVKEAAKDPAKSGAADPAKAAKGPLDKIQLGGAIEVEAGKRRSFSGVHTSDFTLNTAEFDFEADVVDWAKAELSLSWESAADKVTVNEALITLAKPAQFPIYLKAGRGIVPFGILSGATVAARLEETLTLTGPLTVEVFESKEDHMLLGVRAYGAHAAAYVFNGTTNRVRGGGKRLEHYGFTLGYAMKTDVLSFDAGVDMIDSVFDSDGLTAAFPELQHRGYVPGIATHVRFGLGGFSIVTEYNGALRAHRLTRETANNAKTFSIQPRAWQIEGGYTTEMFGKKLYGALSYSETAQLLGTFPKRRMLGSVGSWLSNDIRLAIERGNEQDYGKAQLGTGREADTWTVRLTYEW